MRKITIGFKKIRYHLVPLLTIGYHWVPFRERERERERKREKERERVYFIDIVYNNSLLTWNYNIYFSLFNCLCIVGIADIASLFVLAFVTRYFSEYLVFTLCSDRGNMSHSRSFCVHL